MHAKANIKLEDILGSEVNAKFVDEFIPSKNWANKIVDLLLATQVTTFECGGIALGVSISHKIADASTLFSFLNEWVVMNREENEIASTRPGFNSLSLFHSVKVQYRT